MNKVKRHRTKHNFAGAEKNSLIVQLLLILVVIIVSIPIYIVIINLFKTTDVIRTSPLSFPTVFSLDSLIYVITDPYKNIWELYLNSALVTFGGTILSVLLSSMVAYFIARSNNRLSNFMRTYFMLGLMIPYILVYVPLALLLRFVGLMNGGIPVLIFIYTSNTISFGVFIFTGFIRSLPRDMEESASLDGANIYQTFWRIIFPLLKPATATVAIFVGVAMWNDFLTPMLLGGNIQTITTGIYNAIGAHATDWARVFAYVFMASLPLVIAFLTLQKQFISGLTSGSIKG
ncbi:sugar ABC transporter permease [Clostridia bacterium]|nr:sugar ABC transporter permease [Clostridia bacterium]